MTLSLVSSANSMPSAIGNIPIMESGESDLVEIERLPEVSIPIRMLVPGIQVRAGGADPVHVRLLVEAVDSVRLPSILVQKSS